VTALRRRAWVPEAADALIRAVATETEAAGADAIEARLLQLVEENRAIHERDCINLNPASNTMNPKAEALLASGLGPRASLGYPGDKYEMGLEAIERIEVIAAELAAEIFGAAYAEIRVGSGALANLYAFMATARPGEAIIAPPPEIGGHVTHHASGAAGRYGVVTHMAPVDARSLTVDPAGVRALALAVRPKLITIGGSLNLFPHPVRELRAIADEVGAFLLYDAAHMSGMIAGGAWQQPLAEGAHLMTMSTYKSLGGPPAGLVLTNEADLAERIEAIAYPGLTANFDVSKSAALAMTLLDWKDQGRAYAAMMAKAARALAQALDEAGLPVFGKAMGMTRSHQIALAASPFEGGQKAAKRLRRANILASGIGLPLPPVPGDLNGIRLGTNEIVRRGATEADMPELARLIAHALVGNVAPETVAPEVTAFRRRFQTLHYLR
jgi:glycine hydroxymethyltransferase